MIEIDDDDDFTLHYLKLLFNLTDDMMIVETGCFILES